MEKMSLTALAREQLANAERASSGRSAHTVYGGHEHVLRQTLIALDAGQNLDEQDSPGEATIHVPHGRVRLTAGPVAWEGSAGDLVIVPRFTPRAQGHRVVDGIVHCSQTACCTEWFMSSVIIHIVV